MLIHEVRGQCVAKRAFEVALVADLSVLLVGPIGTSKSALRSCYPEVRSDERESCLCGHYNDVMRECRCNERSVARWLRRMERVARNFDIILEMCQAPAKELMSRNQNTEQDTAHMRERVRLAREFGNANTSIELSDDSARRMMEMATRRLGLTCGQYNAILRVSRAIANLDHSPQLKAKHVAEAVQYQACSIIQSRERTAA